MRNDSNLEMLVDRVMDLDPSLDRSSVRFVGVSEGEDRLRELVKSLVLLSQLRS